MKLLNQGKLSPEVKELISMRFLITHHSGEIDWSNIRKKAGAENKSFTWEALARDISDVTGKDISMMSLRRHFGSLGESSLPSSKAKSAYIIYLGCPDDEDYFLRMKHEEVLGHLGKAIGYDFTKGHEGRICSKIYNTLMPKCREHYGKVKQYIFSDEVMPGESIIIECAGYDRDFHFMKITDKRYKIMSSPSQTLCKDATVEIPFFFVGECLRGLAIKQNKEVQQDYYIGVHPVRRIWIFREMPQYVHDELYFPRMHNKSDRYSIAQHS